LPWEDFSVLSIGNVAAWAASLRFEVGGTREKGFTRHRLEPEQVVRIVTELFGLSPWEEIKELMPTSQPYAYLTLIENGRQIQVFAIDADEVIIGRDWKSSGVLIPFRYALVSRTHARIFRTFNGVFIEDLGSTNGTFVEGAPVNNPLHLHHGQTITLGNSQPGESVCQLEVSFEVDPFIGLDKTATLTL
jgi:hypothetical protein